MISYTPDLVIFDLDMTLIDTSALSAFRTSRNWQNVFAHFSDTTLYDGVAKCILELTSKTKVGVVTNTPRPYAEQILKYHQLNLPVFVAYHDTPKHKPAPEPFLKACEINTVNANDHFIVSIGDDIRDIEASKRIAGLYAIGVTWGVNSSKELYNAGADSIISHIEELIDAFVEIQGD